MEELYVQKDGLLFTPDGKTILGIDDDAGVFSGRVPYGAHYIDDEVFTGCSYESITLPDSIEKLGNKLFANSKNLKTVKLPPEIKELSPNLFYGCSNLIKVYMPNELIGFPEGLFYGCSSLEEIPFRAGIKILPKNVFAECTSLRSLVIPNTVESIEDGAVKNCINLKALVLPSSLQSLSENAFEGCTALRNIRIDGNNKIFFVNEDDGCLYEHTSDGDKLRIKVTALQNQQVSFFKENVDDESDDFYSDEDFDEIDETFSSEVLATEEEATALNQNGVDIPTETTTEPQEITEDIVEEIPEVIQENNSELENQNELEIEKDSSKDDSIGLAEEERNSILGDNSTQDVQQNNQENNIDEMLQDILRDNAGKTAAAPQVAVDNKETQVLSQMMDIMNDNQKPSEDSKVSEDELEQLFSNNESTVKREQKSTGSDNQDNEYSKLSILLNSVSLNKVLEFTPKGEAPLDSDLFVIAENTIDGSNGEKIFTPKLERCCNTFAHIQDFKRVILLNGLPFDNPEFEQFYHQFMANRNVILACEAQSPAKLSDYARKICSESRISLERESLITQRKKISTKNSSLIKLVIQDIYDN